MGYIGQPLNAGNLAVQTGTGDGADTTPIATLNYSVGSSESLAIYLDGVKQAVATYTASGTTLTFTTAPPNGVGIEVVFLALPISLPTPGDSTVTNAKVAAGAAIDTTKLGAGAIVQVVNFQTGVFATGTATIPLDNTIPQITEGTEFMTLAVTPTNASNLLLIDVVTFSVTTTANIMAINALFVGTTVNALATASGGMDSAGNRPAPTTAFRHKMTAGVTTELTFRLRIGGNTASTIAFNGYNAAAYFGGTIASSITITEIQV